jgi:hypothetical protein
MISFLRENKTALGDVIDIEKLNAISSALSLKKQVLKMRKAVAKNSDGRVVVRVRGKTFISN